MRMLFDESGRMVATDYYQSEDYRQRVPCCAVRDGTWHVLLPDPCPEIPQARHSYTVPLVARDQPEGWAWTLCIRPKWTQRLPLKCFLHPPPDLPQPGDEYTAWLHIYGHELPGLTPHPHADFGLTSEPLKIVFTAPLRVVRASLTERVAKGGTVPVHYK